MANDADLVIVGGGPCGLAAAVSAQRAGLRALVIEGSVVVSTIAAYPTYVRFFSTAEKLTIGGLPFVIATEKPTRRDALAYYRSVVTYFGSPNRIGVPGEDLPHVTHLYKEGHEAFLQDVVVVGGGNSAAEAALDLWRSGARVTLVHFGPGFDKKIKPWVLPDFTNRVKEGLITALWSSRVKAIEPSEVVLVGEGGEARVRADRVYVMTGFAPS